jgi:hypothetical protein
MRASCAIKKDKSLTEVNCPECLVTERCLRRQDPDRPCRGEGMPDGKQV